MMNLGVGKFSLRIKSSKVVIISLIVFILIMLAISAQLIFSVLNYGKIYKGIQIDGLNSEGLTKEELSQKLTEKYLEEISSNTIEFKTLNSSKTFSFSDVEASYNIADTVEKAYSIGRTGNIFKRLQDIYKASTDGTSFSISISFNQEKLDKIVDEFYDKNFNSVKEADLYISDDKIIIRSGHHGESIDKSIVKSEAEALISSMNSGVIDTQIIETPPSPIDIDNFYNQINREAVNAYATVQNNIVTVVPHVIGRKLDKDTLKGIVADLQSTEDTEMMVSVEYITPEITTSLAGSQLFIDELAAFSSKFDTSNENNANRAENIRLAVEKINGKILGVGDVFSFNDVVGERTEKAGYKIAHVYSAGEVVDGIGGGICQVSSTLYNSVLRADLEVVERRNHTFTVGYVSYGSDATVSYGGPDFRFKNSTNWPVKVESWITKDNRVHFRLLGTNESPGKLIEIIGETVTTIEPKTIYKDDPNLPVGQTKVIQSGKNGYSVDTYKVVKQNGKVVSQTKLHRSTYQPLDKVVLRGTKVVPTPSPTPVPTPTPTATAIPTPTPSPSAQPTATPAQQIAASPEPEASPMPEQ